MMFIFSNVKIIWKEDMTMDKFIKIAEAERLKEYGKWAKEVPSFQFPVDWIITIIPPFGGATVRFKVTREDTENSISVYLDCQDRLGCVGEPYWEIYPCKGDTERFLMNDTKQLLEGIDLALGNKRRKLTKS